MTSSAGVDREVVMAAYDELKAAHEKVAALSHDALTHPELLALQSRRETMRRREPAIDHRIINRLVAEAEPQALGGTSLADVLATRLRISKREASRRITEAADLGPRTAFTGEPLEPVLPHTAAAQQRGEIGAEHVKIIRSFFHQLPASVDYQTRELAEADLARLAAGLKPEELRQVADRLMMFVHPRRRLQRRRTGPAPPSHHRQARRRRDEQDQRAAGPRNPGHPGRGAGQMGRPGMCNPDDEAPCVDETPATEHKHRDTRSQSQRNHDALKAIGRSVLASGELGQHNGLPATIIVSTTLQELESGAGHAVTGGGSLLPMTDVIRLAAHAHHYLTVYDKHTSQPLYLAHTKRFASAAQRIVLHAKYRGCTRPGCTAPGAWTQAHHVEGWAAADGPTDIDKLTLACPPDNRLVEQGWTTRQRKDGTTEWIPPPHLDTGQTRVNNFHHPERYLCPDDDDDP